MDSKKLLEELRKLTPNFSLKEDTEYSVKDVLDDEDKNVEDEEDVEELNDLEDEEEQEHDEEDDGEEIMDIDGDGEADDIHAISLLKSAFNASSDETKHAVVSIVKLIFDNDIDMDSISKFLDEVDVDVEDDESDDLDDFEDDMFDEPSDEEDELEDEEDEEEDELEDEVEEALSKSESYFTNEGIIAEMYGVDLDGDMGDFLVD